jgi:hypothetical protein
MKSGKSKEAYPAGMKSGKPQKQAADMAYPKPDMKQKPKKPAVKSVADLRAIAKKKGI